MFLEELPYWLALWRIKGIGSSHFRLITERFGSMLTFFSQTPDQLRLMGFKQAQCAQITGFQAGTERRLGAGVSADLDWQDASNQHHILTWASDDYPPLLREIAGAPPVLFVRGDVASLTMPQIAIVGSRHCSRKGRKLAEDFAECFSAHGFITTSGLALGIDAAAHTGALKSGGQTIAVLAHGLDTLYPARNRVLGEGIPAQGALVSEFPIGVQPRPEFFPRRNRIISGLSLGVLVVEAALKSGSLITANEAVDQGREVFAIPGSIHDPLVKGCHALIRNGAKLVETADQIVEELMPLLGYVHQQSLFPLQADEMAHKFDKSSPEGRLLAALQFDAANVDQLVGLTGMSVADVNSTLIMLELEGVVAQEQGGYSRI
ncbi:DNA-protecting protein DprA [Ketobacter sp. MCCC 1A13808]|uniref:DNA-processing protein DprA n=1 Tax=Ketobacter sp. MCCC 1A13808 TaxID=2602738 RepID=UPI000F2522FC|nr:DNA-processing protein DprA [Ketobacter sp. MCCC 1A13808]MVF14286.1 DNA-protecting protein DprA [Ketobacter sp. MCCC 1A13808]RLP53537.1 MAG: DNA-protecting protein DprA [Ketobacter sp.]